MVGFVLATHGGMAEGMIDSASMLVGNTDKIKVLSLRPGMAPDAFEAEVAAALEEADTGDGVLAMVDIFGGTPNNTLYKAAHTLEKNVKIVAGVNLPAIINVLTCIAEDATLDEVAQAVEENAKEQIRIFG